MAPTERAFFAQPVPGVGGRVIASPFQFVTTGEDNLRIISVNAVVGVRVKLQGRWLDSSGDIKSAAWDHTPASDRSATSSDIDLGSGALLNLTVFASAGAPTIGQTFVIVQLIRGVGPVALVLGTLLQGYVTHTQGLGWPGSPIQSSLDGGGAYRSFDGTVPAPGVGIFETVPMGAQWDVLSISATATTDANPGIRRPFVTFLDGFIPIAASVSYGTLGPSASNGFTFAQGLSFESVIAGSVNVSGLPTRLRLLAGQQLSLLLTNVQVGDQWFAPRLSVREWLEVM